MADLEADGSRLDDLNAFLNQTIRTVVVRSWPNEDFLNLIFLRLNTGSVKLSPQELRQALHPGPFTDFLDDYTTTSTQVKRALRIDGPDFRMRDVEILLRYFAFRFFLSRYRGNLKLFLDSATEELNDRWLRDQDYIALAATHFDEAIATTFAIFGDDAFFRWNGNRYEHRFNRAIFDVMVYYFNDAQVREASLERKKKVAAAFQHLCATNREFVAAIQSTTKTLAATHLRLHAWGQTLSIVIDQALPLPVLVDSRIQAREA